MADKQTAEERKYAKELADALRGLGIDGNFVELIDNAVRGDWGIQQFAVRLTRTEAFRNKFPGLIVNGNLNPALTGARDTGISIAALGSAIKAYETAWKGYTDISKNYGYGPISRDKLATLLKSDVSPDEFGTRLQAIRTVKQNPDAFDALKRQAQLAGVPMQPKDLFRFAAKTADKKFYDIYEAAQLQTQVGIKAKDAARLAKNAVGAPGTFGGQNFDQLVAEVRGNLQAYGPELQAQGITAARLVKVLANPSAFTAEMEKIAQVAASRQSMARPGPGIYPSRGSAGGLSLYQDDSAPAYG